MRSARSHAGVTFSRTANSDTDEDESEDETAISGVWLDACELTGGDLPEGWKYRDRRRPTGQFAGRIDRRWAAPGPTKRVFRSFPQALAFAQSGLSNAARSPAASEQSEPSPVSRTNKRKSRPRDAEMLLSEAEDASMRNGETTADERRPDMTICSWWPSTVSPASSPGPVFLIRI